MSFITVLESHSAMFCCVPTCIVNYVQTFLHSFAFDNLGKERTRNSFTQSIRINIVKLHILLLFFG